LDGRITGRITGRIADGARFARRLAHRGNCTNRRRLNKLFFEPVAVVNGLRVLWCFSISGDAAPSHTIAG
jgi:hypothetical protein